MSDLRTRIAEALYGQIINPIPPFSDQPDDVQAAWLADADAVIRELGLKQVIDVNRSIPRSRYVTEWTPMTSRRLWDIFAEADK